MITRKTFEHFINMLFQVQDLEMKFEFSSSGCSKLHASTSLASYSVFICSSWSYWKRVHLLRGSLSNTVTLRVCNCVQTTQKETKMHVLELGQLVTNYSQALKELDHREL